MTLQDWLTTQETRCPGCGFHPELQGCACEGRRLAARGQAIATATHPEDRAKVESAIRYLAARGKPFSANDARLIHGVRGGVVGATFTALRVQGVIRACGDETSTAKSTNGHRIFQWVAA